MDKNIKTQVHSPYSTTEREYWIDLAKAIGIYFIVIIHLNFDLHPLYKNFICTFNLPVFFIISGYFYHAKPFGKEIKKSAKSLLIPYLFFNSIYWILWFSFIFPRHYTFADYHTGIIKPFLGILLGLGYNTNHSLIMSGPCWFLIVLFNIRILGSLITPLPKVYQWIICLLSVCLFYFYLYQFKIPLSINNTLQAIPFFLIGYISKELTNKINKVPIIGYLILFSICTIITIYLAKWTGRIDYYKNEWGNNIILAYLSGLSGSLMILSACRLFKNITSRFIQVISSGTIVILGMHMIIITFVNEFVHKQSWSLLENIIYALIIILAFYYPIQFLQKYIPASIGGRKIK